MNNTIFLWLKRIGASVLFLGYLPFIPGTIGSLLVIVLVWFFRAYINTLYFNKQFELYWLSICIGIAASILLSAHPKQTFGHDDPKPNIIDECIGQWITFFMIPINHRTLILGFFLFRFFDIIKPYPIHKMEDIEGGVGITFDDVVAGVYANVVLMGILWLYHLIRSALGS